MENKKTTKKKEKNNNVEEKIIERKINFNVDKDKKFTTTGIELKKAKNTTTINDIPGYKEKYM